jgi:DNA repair exonuclease SbcCD ATPase subunit
MVVIDEKLKVQEVADKRLFRIERNITDELTAEGLLIAHKQVEDALKGFKQQLEDLPAQKQKQEDILNQQIKELVPRLEALEKGMAKAKVWKAELDRAKKDAKEEQPAGVS